VRKGHVPSSIRTAPATTHILKACGNGPACQRDIYAKVSGPCSRRLQSDYQFTDGGMVARARSKFRSIVDFFCEASTVFSRSPAFSSVSNAAPHSGQRARPRKLARNRLRRDRQIAAPQALRFKQRAQRDSAHPVQKRDEVQICRTCDSEQTEGNHAGERPPAKLTSRRPNVHRASLKIRSALKPGGCQISCYLESQDTG
jgi:hypothetical protein